MQTVLKEILHSDGKRRVLLVDRGGGRYGWEEEYFSDEPREQCWIMLPQYPLSICDSIETAEREARGRVRWLADSTL